MTDGSFMDPARPTLGFGGFVGIRSRKRKLADPIVSMKVVAA
jgi:hypothetical protein